MKELGNKNLFYSLLLAAVMLLFLVGYFIWMLPSLYVSYTEEQNLEAIKKQHQAYLETGTYEHVPVKNPTACVSVKIPYEGPYLELTTKVVSVKITVQDNQMQELARQLQSWMQRVSAETLIQQEKDSNPTGNTIQQLQERMGDWKEEFSRLLEDKVQLPFAIAVLPKAEQEQFFYGESFRVRTRTEHGLILETSIFDDSCQYTNYLAVEKAADGMVFSILPVITPQMEEIRPIVMQSIPMLCAVVLMLVLIFSRLYSNGIVRPVYRKWQDVNQSLLEENERQEMFLRATSHQLKTPITAALLLLDGMIGCIGKYSDREKYLPKVKEQLLSMRRMVEEILSLNQSRRKRSDCRIPLYGLVQAQLASYRVAVAEKQLNVSLEGKREVTIWADADILAKIVDNLLSNAVAYTPCGKRISVILLENGLVIRNEGTAIPKELLSHIFEPFVHGEHQNGSHGLGLYIAAYYANMIDMMLKISNQEDSVEAVLFKRE